MIDKEDNKFGVWLYYLSVWGFYIQLGKDVINIFVSRRKQNSQERLFVWKRGNWALFIIRFLQRELEYLCKFL